MEYLSRKPNSNDPKDFNDPENIDQSDKVQCIKCKKKVYWYMVNERGLCKRYNPDKYNYGASSDNDGD